MPPPRTPQISHPMNIAHRLSKKVATKNVPAPTSMKKKANQRRMPLRSIHSLCGVGFTIHSCIFIVVSPSSVKIVDRGFRAVLGMQLIAFAIFDELGDIAIRVIEVAEGPGLDGAGVDANGAGFTVNADLQAST